MKTKTKDLKTSVTRYSIVATVNPIDLLRELQRKRVGIIKMMNAQNSQIKSYITRIIGYNSFQDEAERKEKWALADKIYASIVDQSPAPDGYDDVAQACAVPVLSVHGGITGLEVERNAIEKNMRQIVSELPICEWWVSERGRAELGLATILGEAGDIFEYENPAKLWKRFGLAVMDGVRQGGLSKGASAEQWIEHGYCPRRRSVMYLIGDCLIKQNRDGKYRKVYDERKEYEIERQRKAWEESGSKKKFEPKYAHARAKRYMEKRVLRDLWNHWHGLDS